MRLRQPTSTAVLLVVCTAWTCATNRRASLPDDPWQNRREAMVATQLASRDIRHSGVLQAMREVPRHQFVPEEMQEWAYSDSPLPIGLDQTISQPYIVALMTQLAEPRSGDRALEIGTGSGYQAAVLSRLVSQVFTIEIVAPLAARAEATLRQLGYDNVSVRAGDGYAGWAEAGPFEIILITAAAPRLPEPLVKQLAEGGRLVAPMGEPGSIQELVLYRKRAGRLQSRQVIPVRFVPMTGQVQEP
jgi:protein-L-isoaspartate(D-aspartate) O-methyltransferase